MKKNVIQSNKSFLSESKLAISSLQYSDETKKAKNKSPKYSKSSR